MLLNHEYVFNFTLATKAGYNARALGVEDG